jgi:hypothetical protein
MIVKCGETRDTLMKFRLTEFLFQKIIRSLDGWS